MTPPLEGLAVRLYALALRAFPRRIRRDYGAEMIAAFAASHAAARAAGPGSARRYTRRASFDALRAGLRERTGGGGVGAPQPRKPSAELWRRGREPLWREVGGDVRFAFRSLRHAPGFSLTVIAVLALGVGINGAIFTAVSAALLAPLPYPEPDQLVLLDYTAAETDPPTAPRAMGWSWPKYQALTGTELDLGELPLERIAAYATTTVTLTGSGNATRLQAEAITPDYFAVLGIDVPMGRPFAPAGFDEPALEAILSHGLWQEAFGGAVGAIGESVTVSGRPLTIVGVAAPGFAGLSGEARLWVPVPAIGALVSPARLRPGVHWLQAIGRMGDEAIPLELVSERIDAAVSAIDEVIPLGETGMQAGGGARSMAEARRNPRAQRAVLVVAIAAGLVLLTACVNLAALMLARGSDRRREIAVRLALGGSRLRIARGLACETLLLAIAGCLGGIALAAAGARGVAAMWPQTFVGGGWNLIFVDPSAFSFGAESLAYTLLLGSFAAVLFGIGPVFRLSRADLGAALKESGKSVTGATGTGLRRWLVAAEIAAALVLLVGAGLMLGSLARLLDIDTGFNEDNLLVFEYSLPRDSAWADDPAAFHDELFGRLRALPQVQTAAGGLAPLRGYHLSIVGVTRVGDRILGEGERKPTGIQTVTDEYFSTLQAPLLRGRTFDDRDRAGGPISVVINETAARELFGDTDPVGASLAVTYGPTADGPPAEIIGVVGDVLYDTRENGTMSETYYLQRQNPEGDLQGMVRTAGHPYDVLADVRAVFAAIDPTVALHSVTTAEDLAAAQVSDTRIVMRLLVGFAALAMLLAATGIWGVVSYSVVRRRRELGIRMALGARSEQAVGLILRRSVLNAVAGVAVGCLVAYGLAGYLESLLFEVEPGNPVTFAGAAALLLAVSLLAAWVPARRATRVDPTETLRSE